MVPTSPVVSRLSAAPSRRLATRWWLAALVALLAGGVLFMHALAGGIGLAGEMAGMDHADHLDHLDHVVMGDMAAMADQVAVPDQPTGASLADDSGSPSSAMLHCGVEDVCLALLAAGLLLLGARRGRALLSLPRIAAILDTPPWPLLAGRRGPPDLHALSIQRC